MEHHHLTALFATLLPRFFSLFIPDHSPDSDRPCDHETCYISEIFLFKYPSILLGYLIIDNSELFESIYLCSFNSLIVLFLFVITTSYSQLLIFEQVNRIRDIVLKKVLYIYIYIESFVALSQHSLRSKVRNLFCDCVSIWGSIRNYISSIENPNKPRVKIFALNKKRNSLPSPPPLSGKQFHCNNKPCLGKITSFIRSLAKRKNSPLKFYNATGRKKKSLSLSLFENKKRGEKKKNHETEDERKIRFCGT